MDRIPSDHPDISSVRAHVSRHGGSRRRIELSSDLLPDAETVRLVLDGTVRYAALGRGEEDTAWITGVFDSPRLARTGGGTDRLQDWLDRHERDRGSSVHVDVITPEYAIGLRAPGERNVYPTIQSPGSSLDDIARSLDE